MAPGILFVTMRPSADLPLSQFHDWYNNEHGPTRLRLPHIFGNGLRYASTSLEPEADPPFLAVYDVADTSLLATATYADLRTWRSAREGATISRVDVDRRFYDHAATSQSPLFMPVSQLADAEAAGLVLVAVETLLKPDIAGPGSEGEKAFERWYDHEHTPLLSEVPGWLRTRRFKSSKVGAKEGEQVSYLALHEYTKVNGLGGDEHMAAMRTPWRDEVNEKYVQDKIRRTYKLFYVFGPAPRDLGALAALGKEGEASPYSGVVTTFTYNDVQTTTDPDATGANPAIESSVLARDEEHRIHYRLEAFLPAGGSGDVDVDSMPLLAFTNSLLTSWAMWDPVLPLIRASFARTGVRLLRYDARGRRAGMPARAATMDELAEDLADLLDGLRVERVDALLGVSVGGATVLRFVGRFGDRVARWVAADFNAVGTAANAQAWKDRVVVAEGPGEAGEGGKGGMRVLAEQTVRRWFHPDVVEGKKEVARWMEDMVAANDVPGFAHSCQALWAFDLRKGDGGDKGKVDKETAIGKCDVPGLLVAGEGDGGGKLVEAMRAFRAEIGNEAKGESDGGVELKVVPGAGHLPMCEQPEAFWAAVESFVVG